VADFDLVREDGSSVGLSDLTGRPWVLCCFFTTCLGPCPDMSRSMAAVQEELSDTDVILVSLTVDPEHDTEARLLAYADQYDAQSERWWFLRGELTEIYPLIRDSFRLPVGEDEAARADGSGHWYTHDVRLVAVDRENRVRGWYHHRDGREGLVARMRYLAGL